MTKKQQEIVREVLTAGTLEVTLTPIVTRVRSCYVDQDGIKHVGIGDGFNDLRGEFRRQLRPLDPPRANSL